MNKMKKAFEFILFCSLVIGILSGCCGRCCNNCFRRPQVMEKMEPWVLDYSEICPNTDRIDHGDRQPLTDDMFDPNVPLDSEYRLAVGDIVDIFVVGEDVATNEQFIVAPDGKVYYSLCQDGVSAAGRTTQEVGTEIAANLKHLFLDPIVTVVPKVAKGFSFKILGRIRQPGIYPITGQTTLKEAFGIAGGLYSRANTNYSNSNNNIISLDEPIEDLRSSYIVRNNRKLDIDFVSLVESADNSQNIFLKPGDFIYVAPSRDDNVYVLGAVPAPHRVPYYHGITMMSALADAGALVYPGPYTANLRQILVLRGALDCPCVMQVDIMQILEGQARDIYLQPQDIVYAQDKPYRLGRELIYIAIASFLESFATTAANYWAYDNWFLLDRLLTTDTTE